jgi:hypothetical protein
MAKPDSTRAERPDTRAAVAAALGQEPEPQETDETEATADEAEGTEEEVTDSSSPGAQDDVELEGDGQESEAEPEASGEGTDEVPMSLLDVDLSHLSAEDRQAVIKTVEEQNKLIGKLMRERAEGDEPPEDAPAPTPEPLTDEALAQALGLDMENPYDENTAKVALPLARMVLELKAQVEGVASVSQASQAERYWNESLDKLEAENGSLPVPRANFFEYAADNSIDDPELAYWRVMGPARSVLIKEVTARKKAVTAEKKKQATTVRPRTTTPTEKVGLKAKTTKAATLEAAQLAAEELGINWGGAWSDR